MRQRYYRELGLSYGQQWEIWCSTAQRGTLPVPHSCGLDHTMTHCDIIARARAFVRLRYAPILEGLDLALPGSIEAVSPAGWIVQVEIADPIVARVLVGVDGAVQLAPKPE